jgi:exopolysaccharide biosynthesis polyprenyl glycosylphosphotransferase
MTSLTNLFDAGLRGKRGAVDTRRVGVRPTSTTRRGRVSSRPATGVIEDIRPTWRSLFPSFRARILLRETLIAALAGMLALTAGVDGAAIGWIVAFAVMFPLTAAAYGAYRWRVLGEGPIERRALFLTAPTVTGLLSFVGYLGLVAVPPVVVVGAVPLALGAIVGTRVLTRLSLVRRRRDGLARVRALVVGTPALSRSLVEQVRTAPGTGYEVVGWCPVDGRFANGPDDVAALGSLGALSAIVAEHEVDVVLLAGTGEEADTARELSWALTGSRASLVVVPAITEIANSRVRVRPVADLWSVQLDVASRPARHLGKDLFDVVVGSLLLVFAGLVVVPAMIAVRLTSPGKALYKQTRVGKDQRPFTMWKVRSMYVDADARRAALMEQTNGNGLLFKMRDDPRITPVGKWLRRLSIDELPQLVNVVRGEMSIVGPRPALLEETEQYVGKERRRLVVKPGLTGLWQVSGRSDLSRDESMRLDLRYVDNISVAMDAAILSRTARAVLGADGAY